MSIDPTLIYERNPILKTRYLELPKYVLEIIKDLNLTASDDDKAKEFLIKLSSHNIGPNTVKKYFTTVKNEIFPTTIILPFYQSFMKTQNQVRQLSKNEVEKLLKFFENNLITSSEVNNSLKCTIAILFAIYTGLRFFEIMQLTTKHIFQMSQKCQYLTINVKYGKTWEISYSDKLNELIDTVIYFFKKDFELTKKTNISIPIFKLSKSTIHYYLQNCYRQIFNKEPHFGFGMHTFRYYLATYLYKQNPGEGLRVAQKVLGHKSINTTKRYIKTDNENLTDAFEKINKQMSPLLLDNAASNFD